MTTKIYGYSDDNVCSQGDFRDEWGCFETDLMVICSDGTRLKTHYGKTINGADDGVWAIELLEAGYLFDRIDLCFDSDAKIYSDIAWFKDGLTDVRVESIS
jgi:hypothetical protein